MHTLLLWSVRIASIFLAPLLPASMMLIAESSYRILTWTPMIGFVVTVYLAAWRIDVRETKLREVKRRMPSN